MTTSSVKNRRRQDIDRPRGQLDDTLKELTHKIDIPARVREKVHDTKENMRVEAEEVKQHEQAKTEEAEQQVHEGAEALQTEVGEVAQQTDRPTPQIQAEPPSPVAVHVEPLMAPARQRPLVTVGVAVGMLLVLLMLRNLLRENS